MQMVFLYRLQIYTLGFERRESLFVGTPPFGGWGWESYVYIFVCKKDKNREVMRGSGES